LPATWARRLAHNAGCFTAVAPMTFTIEHLAEQGRFQTQVEGRTCVADYELVDGVMVITHTEVPTALGGRGIAAKLTRALLAHASAAGLKVRPRCSYARVYMQRHPETLSLLA
jgi:predicted GNAT family acetyltransferase